MDLDNLQDQDPQNDSQLPVVLDDDEPEDDENAEPRHVFELSDDDTENLEDLFKRMSQPRPKRKAHAAPSAKGASTTTSTESKAEEAASRNGDAVEPEEEPVSTDVVVLQAQVEQEHNNALRALADLHNFKRRTADEYKRVTANANEQLLKEIFPIVDDFERSLAAAREAQSYEQLVEGVDAVYRKMTDVLGRQGVEPIPTVGGAFDPELHEAVSVQEGSEEPDESVVQELRKGYKLHGKVVRPALVVVAKS